MRCSNNYEKLKAEAEKVLPDMQLFTGCETLFTKHTLRDVLRTLDDGEFLTLNSTYVVLTEFHPYASTDEVEQVVQKLLSKNMRLWLHILNAATHSRMKSS